MPYACPASGADILDNNMATLMSCGSDRIRICGVIRRAGEALGVHPARPSLSSPAHIYCDATIASSLAQRPGILPDNVDEVFG